LGQTKLGLSVQCENWACGIDKAKLRGQINLGFRGLDKARVRGQCEIGLRG